MGLWPDPQPFSRHAKIPQARGTFAETLAADAEREPDVFALTGEVILSQPEPPAPPPPQPSIPPPPWSAAGEVAIDEAELEREPERLWPVQLPPPPWN